VRTELRLLRFVANMAFSFCATRRMASGGGRLTRLGGGSSARRARAGRSPILARIAELDPTARTPWLGRPEDRRAAVRAVAFAVAATAVYVALAQAFARESAPTPLEIAGTIASLACVWLTRRQNVLCMPLGLVGVVASGWYFFGIGLVGQGWLHVAYYVPTQIWGWWEWIRGGEHRTEKPVAWVSPAGRVALLAFLPIGTLALARLFSALHGPSDLLMWDASIVAASLAAQWLMTLKRIESWLLWLIPVDVSAVLLYLASGAYLFAALYALYLVIASLGLRDWILARRAQERGLSVVEARTAA
jgi:nicotinamide mononucleotide transporter